MFCSWLIATRHRPWVGCPGSAGASIMKRRAGQGKQAGQLFGLVWLNGVAAPSPDMMPPYSVLIVENDSAREKSLYKTQDALPEDFDFWFLFFTHNPFHSTT